MHYQNKMMLREVLGNLRSYVCNFFTNQRYLVKRSLYENDYAALRNSILSIPSEVRERYANELAYIESMQLDGLGAILFHYKELKSGKPLENFVAGKEKGLPFVLHGDYSRLYFTKHTPLRDVVSEYRALVEREGLLGTGILEKSPHCYQDGDFKVEQGDVLLDVGCAEAVFALDNIEKVSKVYLFESLPEWRKPLRRTFEPYADKVVFVPKLVSDRTTGNAITLMDAVKNDRSDDAQYFVKMDIEGWERAVVKGNADFFTSAKVKLSCCVYHRQDDARVLDEMLKGMGYKTRFSDGYMLPTMNGIHYPYFRQGVIYAQNF